MIKQRQKIVLYVFFGVITTVLNIAIYTLLRTVFHSPSIVAYVAAWFLAVLYAFWSNRKAVFESDAATLKQLLLEFSKFAFSRITTGVLGWLILSIGTMIYPNDIVWNIFQNVAVIATNYIISQYFVFTKHVN